MLNAHTYTGISKLNNMGRLCLSAILCAGALLTGVEAVSAQPAITLRIDTVSVSPDSATVTIPVWLDNPSDTLGGFTVWFQLDRPGMIMFESTVDTLYDTAYWNCISGVWPACVDSELVSDTSGGYDFSSVIPFEVFVGAYDSSGALISGWEFVDGRTIAGNGFDVTVSAISNLISPPNTPGIAPQTGGRLFNLVATVLTIPDTLSDRTVFIVSSLIPDMTNFSNQLGDALDFQLTHGSVTILPRSCCDTPGDADNSGSFNIADVTFGIARIFSSGPAPACQDEADANGDNTFNIADVTYGIARIFSSGPAPVCGTTGS